MVSISELKTGSNSVSGAIERSVKHAANNLNQAIDKASGAVHPAVDQLAEGAHQAVHSVSHAASRAAERIDTRSRQWRDVQSRLSGNCSDYVRDKPVNAMGIAVVAGIILGWLLKRR